MTHSVHTHVHIHIHIIHIHINLRIHPYPLAPRIPKKPARKYMHTCIFNITTPDALQAVMPWIMTTSFCLLLPQDQDQAIEYF